MKQSSSKKLTVARYGKALSLELIPKENEEDYYHIIAEMDPSRHPQAMFVHCCIVNQADRLSTMYDRVIIIALHVKETVLRQNYRNREATTLGDFRNVDPMQQQEEILHTVRQLQHIKHHILNINSLEDYHRAFQEILALIHDEP